MKVIFLDVDGVLNCCTDNCPETNGINLHKVKILKDIKEKTNAVIVLSSSWKLGFNKNTGTKKDFYKMLEECLKQYGLEIYDITDNLPCTLSKNGKKMFNNNPHNIYIECDPGTGRGEEIRRWITKNNVNSFVILDDENWSWEQSGLEKNWIQTNYYKENGGLQKEHVEKAIRILNGE